MLLTEKYQELLESKNFKALEDIQKDSMAVLLENQEKALSEATVDADVADFTQIFLPLTRRVQPALIANTLLGNQPLNKPTGFIYSLSFHYTGMGADANDKTAGRISPVAGGQIMTVVLEAGQVLPKGTIVTVGGVAATVIHSEEGAVLIDAKIGSAGADINDEADSTKLATCVNTFSDELGFRKVLKAYTGSLPTSEAELLGYNIAEIGFTIAQVGVSVRSRKLKAAYTMEMYQDLKAVHGLSADKILLEQMSNEMKLEIDREVIDFVNLNAESAGDFKIGGTTADGSTRFELEGMAHIGIKIANEARKIAKSTRRGKGNVLLVSSNVVTVLEAIKGFKAFDVKSAVTAGVNAVGTFNGMTVVEDIFSDADYCTVIYKGSNTDAIGYYSPYVTSSPIRLVDPSNGQPSILINTRYALTKNPMGGEVYARRFSVVFSNDAIIG